MLTPGPRGRVCAETAASFGGSRRNRLRAARCNLSSGSALAAVGRGPTTLDPEPLSGRNSTYRLVQISETSSEFYAVPTYYPALHYGGPIFARFARATSNGVGDSD
jgi:hypothetical protein